MTKTIMKTIIEPTIRGMAADGIAYRGVLFAGLMITDAGPKLIEYNCRFGDPECQALMMRLKNDFLEVLEAAVKGELDQVELKWRNDAALTVVMAVNGYPGGYEKGSEIKGIEEAEANGAMVFHSGTKADGDKILADGGRVLSVTASAPSVAKAQAKAYDAVAKIEWPEGFCRSDIGWRAINR